MKRATPLSMKRLHILSADFLINLGVERGTEAQPLILDFIKFIWNHKDDDLLPLPNTRWDKSMKAREAAKAALVAKGILR